MSVIQQNIAAQLEGKQEPTTLDLCIFVGMIETGEATYDDFREVGGGNLSELVAQTKQAFEDDRLADVLMDHLSPEAMTLLAAHLSDGHRQFGEDGQSWHTELQAFGQLLIRTLGGEYDNLCEEIGV